MQSTLPFFASPMQNQRAGTLEMSKGIPKLEALKISRSLFLDED